MKKKKENDMSELLMDVAKKLSINQTEPAPNANGSRSASGREESPAGVVEGKISSDQPKCCCGGQVLAKTGRQTRQPGKMMSPRVAC